MRPTVTVIVPTVGRPTLRDTIASIPPAWGVLVVADGPEAHRKARSILWGTGRCVVRTQAQTEDIGHSQRNAGMRACTSSWLQYVDDDDVYVPGVQQIVEPHLHGDVPVIFQMRLSASTVLWRTRELKEGNVGTPMFAVPNIPGKLGAWPSKRSGDFDFIRDTCERMGAPRWVEQVIAVVRP